MSKTDTKVVRLTIPKVPKMNKGVKSVFRRAIDAAEKQGWSKIVIVGQGKTHGAVKYSVMLDISAFGLLERAKIQINEDFNFPSQGHIKGKIKMLNVTSQYPTQQFLSVAQSQIISQINNQNASNIPVLLFPKKFRRVSQAGTAPDGSGAVMYQFDGLIQPNSTYSYSSLNEAQQNIFSAAQYTGMEFYIELSPLTVPYYQILTWQSNI